MIDRHIGQQTKMGIFSIALVLTSMAWLFFVPCNGLSIHCASSVGRRKLFAVPSISNRCDHERSKATSSTTLSSSSVTDNESSRNTVGVDMADLQAKKTEIISTCQNPTTKPSKIEINTLCNSLERLGEQLGAGQGSSYSGLMGGEWELLYSPEDITRSSPFFWAFRKAFPDQSDEIFSITDSIPAPIKEVGPATQTIELTGGGGGTSLGTLVSRVKVATLGGLATSMMTTRTTIVGVEGLEGFRLKIETTKPEDSTILKSLGPLGETINSNSPPFPSGEALEKVNPGSSEVSMKTTYCDETLRISRNSENLQDAYVWRRKSFGSSYQV